MYVERSESQSHATTESISFESKAGKKQKSKRLQALRVFHRKTRRELKKRRRRRDWLKHGRPKNSGILRPSNPGDFTKVVAPQNFSFIESPEDVLSYFAECRALLADRKQVEFDLAGIDNLRPDALALMIAYVKDLKFTRGLGIRGLNPSKPSLNKIFLGSKFLDHVQSGMISNGRDENRLIHKTTNNKVENHIARDLCALAVFHTFGKRIKFRPIFEVMIECMANTNNHAGLKKQGKYDWWTLLYSDPDTKVTTFSFLDLGVGIFDSLPVQGYLQTQARELLVNIKERTNFNLVPQYNLAVVPKLFSGELFLTRTFEKNRGKGLPLIYRHSQNQNIKNFTIISNNMYIKLPSLEVTPLKQSFRGTFLYWELHP